MRKAGRKARAQKGDTENLKIVTSPEATPDKTATNPPAILVPTPTASFSTFGKNMETE